MERPSGMSSNQKKRWNDLEGRDILSTKFFDVPTLRVLDFEPTVHQLLEKGGLREFVDKNAPTYPSLVREFFSTLKAREVGGIDFRLRGRAYHSDRDRFARAFGVSAEATEYWYRIPKATTTDFWHGATGRVMRPKAGEYNYSILHPSLRLCHKVLNNTFFGQAEINKVSLSALSYLWCLTPEGDQVPDWVELFLQHCKDALGDGTKRKTAPIGFGGLVTLIAWEHRVNTSDLQDSVGDNYRLDLAALRRANHLVEEGPSFIWQAGKNNVHKIRVPRPLPFRPTVADFFIPHDAPIGAPAIGFGPDYDEGGAEEEEDDEDDAPPTEPMDFQPGPSRGVLVLRALLEEMSPPYGHSSDRWSRGEWCSTVCGRTSRTSARSFIIYVRTIRASQWILRRCVRPRVSFFSTRLRPREFRWRRLSGCVSARRSSSISLTQDSRHTILLHLRHTNEQVSCFFSPPLFFMVFIVAISLRQ